MTKREDGKETRRRLLKAASAEFARNGYQKAKVADICKRAGANQAAVNYYFRNKAGLYAETWQHTCRESQESMLPDMTELPPEERLHLYIRMVMQNLTDEGDPQYFSRLYLREVVSPTGLIQDGWQETIQPWREKLHHLIRELMGPNANAERVRFCEMSILNQCRMLITINRHDLEMLLEQPLSPEVVERMVNHITAFSLAGITAVGRGGP